MPRRHVFLPVLFIAILFAMTGSFLAPPDVASAAINPGDLTLTILTGVSGTPDFQRMVPDSNNCPTDGPTHAYVGYRITNPIGGAGTLTNLSATLSGFDVAGFGLAGGQPATLDIGSLADGQSKEVYWYVSYPCDPPGSSVPNDTVTVTVVDGTTGSATKDVNLWAEGTLTAQAGSVLADFVIGTGAVLGQILEVDVTYTYNNIPANGEIVVQPSGEGTFNAACFQLVGTQIQSLSAEFDPTGLVAQSAATDDYMYFTVGTATGGGGIPTLVMRYYFLYKCGGETTIIDPYGAATSGTPLKYTPNYGTFCLPAGSIDCTLPAGSVPPIAKSVSPSTIPGGGQVQYTITINNPVNVDTIVDQVTDVLPAGVTYGALVNGASCGTNAASEVEVTAATSSSVPVNGATGAIAWTSKAPDAPYVLPASGTLVVCYTANVTSTPGTYVNQARANVFGVLIDSTPDNLNDNVPATAPVTVPAYADLSLQKQVSAGPYYVGDSVTFTITVTNDGPQAATGIVVNDVVPAGISVTSVTPATGSWTAPNWSIPTLAVDASTTLTIVGTLTTTGIKTNGAEITASNQLDPDSTPNNHILAEDDQDQVQITVLPTADLSLTKTYPAGTYYQNDPITYTVTLTNRGPNTATNVTVTDVIPAGITVGTVTPSAGTSWSAPTWTIPSLANGASATLTIEGTINTTGTITNTAEVTASDQHDPDSTPNNNVPTEDDQASATVIVGAASADLSLTKVVTTLGPYDLDSTVTFLVTVTNGGPSAASGVTVSDVIPAGITLGTVTPSAGTSWSAPTWTIGSLAVSGSATLTITGTINSPDLITNMAQVQTANEGDPDSTPGNSNANEDDQASASVQIRQADLSLTKVETEGGPYFLDDPVSFVISLNNAGPDTATNIVVADAIPAGIAVTTVIPSAGSWSAVNEEWTISSLAASTGATLTINGTITATGDITNAAEVTDVDQYDPDSTPGNADTTPEDDDDSVTLNVALQADLELTKTYPAGTYNTGDPITFTVTLTNKGPDTATNVEVTDAIPAELTSVTVTPQAGTSWSDPTWTIPSLASGNSVTLTVSGTINSATVFTNTAEVTASDQYDPDSTPDNNDPTEDDQASATVTPGSLSADLELTKEVTTAGPYSLNKSVTFLVTLTNNGPDAANNIVVQDAIPSGITLGTVTPSAGSWAGSPVNEWSLSTLAVDASETLTITGTINSASLITNTAQVWDVDESDPDSTPGNSNVNEDDQDSASLQIESADLSLTKATSSPGPFALNDPVTWIVTLTNGGPDTATNVTVSDVIPAGISGVTVTPDAGTTWVDPTWTIPSLASGASTTLTIDGTIAQTGTISNTAEVTASDQNDPDSTPDNNDPNEDDQDTSSIVVGPTADLSITKSVDDDTPSVGDVITYTIIVTNDGPDDATGVEATDNLPAGLSYDTCNPPASTSFDTGSGVWTIGDLPASSSVTLTCDVNVDEAGQRTNQVEVTAADQPDPDSTPNNGLIGEDDLDSQTINPLTADLSLKKKVNTNQPAVGDVVTYTISITNNGDDDATGVSVVDQLPVGLQFEGYAADAGTYNEVNGVWSIGDLANGETLDLTINARVLAPTGASGEYTNYAQVQTSDQIDPDSTPGDNSSGDDDDATASIRPVTPPPTVKPPDGGPRITAADPSFVKAGVPLAATIGETVNWTITITNPTGSDLNNIVVSDPVPGVFDIISATTTVGSTSVDGQIVTVSIPVLKAGQTVTVTIETITNEAAVPGEVCNTAYWGTRSASGCIGLYPGDLPPAGGRPFGTIPPLVIVGGIAALMALFAVGKSGVLRRIDW